MRARRLSAWGVALILAMAVAPAAWGMDSMEDASWIEAIDRTERTVTLNGEAMVVSDRTRIVGLSGGRSTFARLRGPVRRQSGAGAHAVRYRAERSSSRGPWQLVEIQVIDPEDLE